MAGHRGTGLAMIAALALAGCQQSGDPMDAPLGQVAPAPVPPAIEGPASIQAAASGGIETTAMPPPLDTSRMQPAQIIDQNGFGQPMVAADVQIPAGWQAVGGVAWNDATNCVANQLQLGWTAMAPDSLTAVEILPGFHWQVAGTEIQMNPCPAAPWRSTREFLEATVQRTRPGARVLGYERLADVEQQMAQAAQANPQAQIRHDAGRLMIGYAKDGVEMRELLSTAITFSSVQGNVVAGTATISSLRAPEGRMDPELGKRIGDSMRPNPQWMQAMRQRSMASLQRYDNAQRSSINDWHNRQMAIINARGNADRAAIRMRGNQETAGIYNAIAAGNSRSSDTVQRQTIDGIYERNSHAGIDGSVVQSSIHGGDRVFQDNNDPNIAYSTNDPYAAPANATELQQMR